MKKGVAMAGGVLAVFTGIAHADTSTWTPLITSSSFTGILTDVGTAAAGIVSVCLVIVGVSMLVRVFR